ncbi:MAG TPA: hypothetical protein VMU41_12255 [Candidatus Binataceae bacterium]|nr:hypothetical protein [Candidatus Binataceae bacterium]
MSVTSSERLKDFFLSLVRQSFGQLGVGDRPITDYIATVLTDFSRSERLLALRGADGRRLTSVVEMMLSQISPSDRTRVLGERELRKHIGDYTLFMSGLFRRFVERGGYLDYYLEEGARSYHEVSRLAAGLDTPPHQPNHLMFEELSKGFEHYSGALDFMRKCYFSSSAGDDPFAGFYRHVQGWVRNGLSNN